ncbi:transcription factor Tfb4 [Nitzschia inconspicua]|uniref:Transcription factor Tfb4 n=1 Tax=Nitzschia inconspicua TaxID=303405 RepID=A0A9K3LAP9_9STRA|nr:transcription factor Tfb4 [Nitzschia inconspicua]KAG7358224.1 transcription factor Tfb4 [Nitzschia inconspicua]
MKQPNERSLTVIVMDVSPVTWGERELIRTASDKSRLAAGKRSIGPARLEECLSAVQCFCSAASSLEKDAVTVLVAVAASEVAVVYPRKDALEDYFRNPENKLDSRNLQSNLLSGVAELMAKASAKQQQSSTSDPSNPPPPLTSNLAAMASAFSTALCLINRFLVAANAGVSALHDHHSWNRGNRDDDGVIAALGGGTSGKKPSHKNRVWSPRVLLLQASDDRPSDYNAMMNCAFAAVKQQILVDACFILSPSERASKSSSYLEQTCDMTGGLLSTPSAASQADKALTEVLLTIFLPTRSSRHRLNQVAITNLDFRARSFDTGQIVDMAFVCNQCLSIFSQLPQGRCPTCDAEIRSKKSKTEP